MECVQDVTSASRVAFFQRETGSDARKSDGALDISGLRPKSPLQLKRYRALVKDVQDFVDVGMPGVASDMIERALENPAFRSFRGDLVRLADQVTEKVNSSTGVSFFNRAAFCTTSLRASFSGQAGVDGRQSVPGVGVRVPRAVPECDLAVRLKGYQDFVKTVQDFVDVGMPGVASEMVKEALKENEFREFRHELIHLGERVGEAANRYAKVPLSNQAALRMPSLRESFGVPAGAVIRQPARFGELNNYASAMPVYALAA